MPSYVYLQHYTSQGDLGISRDVFVTLGTHVVSYIREKNDKNFTISDNVDVTIRANKVIYKFYVTKKNNIDAKYIEKSISDYINRNLLMICEVVPFEINIKITSSDGE
ncbi:MAG: hypothetical protein WC148_00090 [Bacilli bacterium]|jgi:hypothetical protein